MVCGPIKGAATPHGRKLVRLSRGVATPRSRVSWKPISGATNRRLFEVKLGRSAWLSERACAFLCSGTTISIIETMAIALWPRPGRLWKLGLALARPFLFYLPRPKADGAQLSQLWRIARETAVPAGRVVADRLSFAAPWFSIPSHGMQLQTLGLAPGGAFFVLLVLQRHIVPISQSPHGLQHRRIGPITAHDLGVGRKCDTEPRLLAFRGSSKQPIPNPNKRGLLAKNVAAWFYPTRCKAGADA
jgi:hypothetical protein